MSRTSQSYCIVGPQVLLGVRERVSDVAGLRELGHARVSDVA
jgi:hypothetical protein